MTDADHIERINALTRNARNTWFGLLGVLVFVSITLMGVEHIDFYGVNRATKLPLVDVDVPTKSFFLAAPLLTAAIFGYFHLYLIRLWDALSQAPFEVNGQPLGDAVSPWLVTDAALHLRAKLRQEFCASPRTLEGPAMVLNLALAWGFGIAVLGWLWTESMPAREIWITVVAAIALLASAFAGVSSLSLLPRRMYRAPAQTPEAYRPTISALLTLVVAIPLVGGYSFERTMGRADRLAAVDLYAENLVEKPAGWLPRDIARKDFRATWCKRETVEKCKKLSDEQQREFDAEWKTRRAGQLADLVKPDWHRNDDKPNLRNAFMPRSFLSGADLRSAKLEKGDFREAFLEGTNLHGAQLQNADFARAQLQNTNFEAASIRHATFDSAQLQQANFRGTTIQRTNFWDAQLDRANFRLAQIEGSSFSRAHMEEADFSNAHLHSVVFAQANLSRSVFNGSLLTGRPETNSQLKSTLSTLAGTNLSGSVNEGGALRNIDMRKAIFDRDTDFRNVFLDASVLLSASFAAEMGGLCQRAEGRLGDEEFYGSWRGWIESSGGSWKLNGPVAWQNVTPIPPPEGCEWKTGPLPGSE